MEDVLVDDKNVFFMNCTQLQQNHKIIRIDRGEICNTKLRHFIISHDLKSLFEMNIFFE